MAALSRLAPDRVVPVAAAATASCSPPTRGRSSTRRPATTWTAGSAWPARPLCSSASSWPHLEALLAAGMTALAPEEAHDYVAARVEQYAALDAGDPRRLAPEVADRLRAHLPVVRGWAEQVAALGLPLTLNHNDLHENNVFDVDGRLRFFDFGDSLLTEPLGVLLIPLNILGETLDADGDDPRLWRVADAALEVWSDLVPAAELRAALARGAPARAAGTGRVVGALPAVADRRRSSPSGARSRRPGSGPSTRTRRSVTPASSTACGWTSA